MTQIRFTSNTPGHERHLSKADLSKLGVDSTALKFVSQEPTEVTDEVAKALVALGEFEEVSDKEAAKVAESDDEDEEEQTSARDTQTSAPGDPATAGSVGTGSTRAGRTSAR